MKKNTLTPTRQKIQALLSGTDGLVTLDDVQKILGLTRVQSSQFLYRLTKKGWTKKLQNGLYRVVPLEASDPTHTGESPWIVANQLYSPCYMGLWTSANFWGLTDQLFLDTWVLTTQKVFVSKKIVSDHHFIIRQIQPSQYFGLKAEWIENNKVMVSDPHKTVLDFLNFPDSFSAQTMLEITKAYLASDQQDLDRLFEYVKKSNNRALLKRLGFLLEYLDIEATTIIQYCYEHKSKGISPLSTVSLCDTILTRWNLKIPRNLKGQKND